MARARVREPARGGLNISSPPAVSEKEEVDITNKWLKTYDKVERKMAKLGFTDPDKPNKSTDAITAKMLIDSTPEQFAELSTQRLSWYTYSTPIKAELEARLLGYTNAIEELAVTVRADLKSIREATPGLKMTDKEIKERVEEDIGIRELKFQMQEWQQLKIRVDAKLAIISKEMGVISRMQNERGNEFSGERRDSNVKYERHKRFRNR